MGLTAAAASLIGSGAGLGGGLIAGHFNRKLQRETNDRIISSDWERYGLERKYAVEDRDYDNWYNSPAQQRRRLEEAGFSPMSLFGHGQIAGNSSSPRSANGTSYGNIQPPQFNENLLSDAIGAYFNLTQTMAQTDNMRAQADVIKTDNLLKQAQIENINTQSKLGQFDLGYKKTSAQANLRHLDLTNEKLKADILFTLDSNQRQALASTSNLAKTVQEIASMKMDTLVKYEQIAKSQMERKKIAEEIANLKHIIEISKNESVIKDIERKLEQDGISKSHPSWWVTLYRHITGSATVHDRRK